MDDEDQIVVDVEASHLSGTMQSKLDTLWGKANESKNFTIIRIPRNIFKSKKNLFRPSVISIGPFHHGQTSLRTMEEKKWRFLQDFLSRGDHINLDLCISEMKSLEKRTRQCYSETVDLDSNEFVEMMLLDGCFILEYFSQGYEGNNDSIFEVGWNVDFIDFDLLLLENQIPFFIVEKLYDIGFKQEDKMNFIKHLVRSLPQQWPLSEDSIFLDPPDEIHHLVHLSYHCSVPNPGKPFVLSSKSFHPTKMFSANRIKGLFLGFLSWVLTRRFPHSTSPSLSVPLPNSTENISSMVIPCATELQETGVNFKPKSNPQHMLDISFDRGVLEIPKLLISDDTKPIFANLIAFEHSKYGQMYSPFTSYVAFLDNLINTQNDVMILQQCGIIENWLGSEKELSNFINQVTEGIFYDRDHYLGELFMGVNRYMESSWNRQRAQLIRDYFSSPWSAISIVAALILLVLTFLQSFFAIYAYFIPPTS